MAETVIQTEGLIKRFGSTRALDGLDLEVRAGEVHGFLGPNGAGKTTTIRILLGLLGADAGRAELLGGDPGAMRSACIGAWRMCPATLPCGPTCRVGR
jgi:ABC-2 type transport system ATP-binding protein